MPLVPRRPIESGLGSPSQRGSGKSSGLVCFAKPKSFPARMGAECVSVSPLQAIGLVESLLDDIWLICGSVHPPLSSVKFRQVRFLPLDSKYPKISASRKAHWPELSTYFKYPQSVRTLIYTTNSIENFNRQLRKVSKNRSVFPNDDSLLKILYLAQVDITRKWTGRRRDQSEIHSRIEIFFADRLPE